MCDIPNIPSVFHHNIIINDKILKHLIGFLKTHSDNNIITINSIKKQAYTLESGLTGNFVVTPIQVYDRLIIECRCVDETNFKNKDCIDKMVSAVFCPLIGVSDIRLEYFYSMYYCRD